MAQYPIGRITLGGRDLAGFRIVISENAPAHEREAAADLADCLRRAAGLTLPVVTDREQAVDDEICIGATTRDVQSVIDRRASLRHDGILLRAEDGRLYIQSETHLGVRYAVSKFLEKYVGFRFLDEYNEVIEPAEAVDLPADLDYCHSSPLMYRHTDWRVTESQRRRWGLNGEDGVENRIIGFCHTMTALAGTPGHLQPCLTDEAVYQTVLGNVRKWIRDNPGCRIISVTQNDNFNYCKCPRCEAMAKRENQSGIMISFVNRLADDIRDEYPDVYLLTFAYQYTRKPPVTVKPRDNVIIWLCSIECCFSHALEDASCGQNRAFADDIRAWASIAKHIYIWDYTTNYAHYVSSFPNFRTLLPNTRFFVGSGAIAIYEEGGHQQQENGEFRSLRAYLTGQMLWDPDMGDEAFDRHIKDFLKGYYGAGWQYIYEYVDRTCAKVKEMHMGIYVDTNRIFPDADGKPDMAFCLEMKALWDKAEAAALDERTLRNVRASRCQIDYMTASLAAAEQGKPDADTNRALIGALREAGVVYHREGWGDGVPYWKVSALDDRVAEVCAPNEWLQLTDSGFRHARGLE